LEEKAAHLAPVGAQTAGNHVKDSRAVQNSGSEVAVIDAADEGFNNKRYAQDH